MDGLISLWAQLAQSGTLRTAAQRRAAGYLAAKEAQEAAELVVAKEHGFTSRLDALEQASAVATSNQHGVPPAKALADPRDLRAAPATSQARPRRRLRQAHPRRPRAAEHRRA